MRSRSTVSVVLVVGAVVGAACGGRRREPVAQAPRAFDCRKRIASYVAAHHLAGDELGVQIDCAVEGPRIQRWRTDKTGTRQEDAHSLTPGEFEAVWKEIEGTGWPNLRDCSNGSGAAPDPIYRFEIGDDQHQAAFQCQSQAMPYPYNDIVDPLDLAAQRGRRQLGDDEPRAAKALDRKAKQK
jgi:hypothetical protein